MEDKMLKIAFIMIMILITIVIIGLISAIIMQFKIIKQTGNCVEVNDKYYCEVK